MSRVCCTWKGDERTQEKDETAVLEKLTCVQNIASLFFTLLCSVRSSEGRRFWTEGQADTWSFQLSTVSVSYRLTSPLLGDGSGFQAVFALCSPMWDSFWMSGNIDLVAKGSSFSLCAGHLFCAGLFTWSLIPDDSAAVNPWGSQGSLPLALQVLGLLISSPLSIWPWL